MNEPTKHQGNCVVCGSFVVTDERIWDGDLYCQAHWQAISEEFENSKLRAIRNISKRIVKLFTK